MADLQRAHLSNISESPELFSRQRNFQLTTIKSKFQTREEIKYQRFIKHLKRDVEYNLKQSMREAKFDTRSNPTKPINSAIHSKRTPSSIGTHRSNETETLVTTITNQLEPITLLKQNQKKRLDADVRTVLASPALKAFYDQFICPSSKSTRPTDQREDSIPFVESFFNVS